MTAPAAEMLHDRLMHSSNIGAALVAEIDDWRQRAEPRGEPTISDDRLSWQVVFRLAAPPPLVRWGLLFGDAIHNMRCVLDNLAWQLALLHGQPSKPKEIYFPIATTSKAWRDDRSRKWFGSVVNERLEAVQPFLQHGPGGKSADDPLAWLQQFDNDHKHRVPAVAVLAQNAANHSFAAEFGEEAEMEQEGPPKLEIHDGPLVDGCMLLRAETSQPIVNVTGAFWGDMLVAVETPTGFVGLTHVIRQLGAYVTGLTGVLVDLL